MGYGDKLMAIGDAWKQHQLDPQRRPVAIGDGTLIDPLDLNLTWGLDFLATPEFVARGGNASWVYSYRGTRPYIDYAEMARLQKKEKPWLPLLVFKKYKNGSGLGRHIFKMEYRPTPAPIVLTEEEAEISERWSRSPFAIIEPFIKAEAPPSKQWPVERFVEVAKRLDREIPVYQIAAPNAAEIAGLKQLRPRSFRESMAYLRAARFYIGPEGGLHHASASMGTRAVVIFGGFTPPEVTGYDFHINLTGGTDYFCGTLHKMCPHCRQALDNISVDEVLMYARTLLETQGSG